MSIHSEHPFADPDDPVRRLRGRLGAAVSLWTAGEGPDRAGLTVGSQLVARGEPSRVLALLDPEADLTQRALESGRAVVQLLEWTHRDLAEAFAGQLPAPGGPFTLGTWTRTPWGPVLDGASAWAGLRLEGPATEVGWSLLLTGVVERVVLEESTQPLLHRRGRYLGETRTKG